MRSRVGLWGGLWARRPRTAVDRARLGALVYGLCVLSVVPQLREPDLPSWRQALGLVAAVLIAVIHVATFRRRRPLPWEPLAIGLGLVAAGTSLSDPLATIALCLGAVVAQSMYGPMRDAVVRLVVVAAALPVTISIAPLSLGRYIPWYSPQIIGMAPALVMIVLLMRALLASLTRLEESLADPAHRAHHDPLTGLPNRVVFFDRLMTVVDSGDQAVVMIIDLDDFKGINDTYGHGAGNGLLTATADRLREAVGTDGMAARLAGDEFAVVLQGVAGPEEAERAAEALNARLRRPVRLGEVTVSPSASIGLALGEPGLSAADLLRCADVAMYWAKARGKSRVARYTGTDHSDVVQLRMFEEHLAHAADRGEIVVHYQPHVDMATGRCVGMEALARWQHPTMGLVPPGTFIPVAERTGHIVPIGAIVLRTACRQLADWVDLPGGAELRLAVNVAARQLVDGGFADTVRRTLSETGMAPHRLTIELTESEVADDDDAVGQLREIAALGVRISIDDFGAKYASLASLHSFPVHQIKIDRSFIHGHGTDRTEAMLQLVISVGQILDLETVAGGVETNEQADALREAGVPLAQGYLFARPMPAEEFREWLTAGRALTAAGLSA